MTFNLIAEHKTPMTARSVSILFIDIQPGIIDAEPTAPPISRVRRSGSRA